MKIDKHTKNVGYGILSYIIIFLVFKLAGITADAKFWVITILLLLIYIELCNPSDKKK